MIKKQIEENNKNNENKNMDNKNDELLKLKEDNNIENRIYFYKLNKFNKNIIAFFQLIFNSK